MRMDAVYSTHVGSMQRELVLVKLVMGDKLEPDAIARIIDGSDKCLHLFIVQGEVIANNPT